MVIPFTDREIEKAWRDNWSASCKTPRSNAHRLLLFYAVECGLKAVLMKRGKPRTNRTDLCIDIAECQHDVNKLLDCLSAGNNLKLPSQLTMKPAILILKKNQIKFSYLNRELVLRHDFLTDNYHPTLEIDSF